MAFKSLEIVFAQTGVPQRFSADSLPVTTFTVQVKRANSNSSQIAPVNQGEAAMATGKAFELAKPTADQQLPEKEITSKGGNCIDLQNWFAMGTATEGLNVIYEEW